MSDDFISTEDEQGQPLPPRLIRKQRRMGTYYYVDDDRDLTSLESPVEAVPQELREYDADGCERPHPWTRRCTKDGEAFYIRSSLKTWKSPTRSTIDSRDAAGALNLICFEDEKPRIWCENAAQWLELPGWQHIPEDLACDMGSVIDTLVDSQCGNQSAAE